MKRKFNLTKLLQCVLLGIVLTALATFAVVGWGEGILKGFPVLVAGIAVLGLILAVLLELCREPSEAADFDDRYRGEESFEAETERREGRNQKEAVEQGTAQEPERGREEPEAERRAGERWPQERGPQSEKVERTDTLLERVKKIYMRQGDVEWLKKYENEQYGSRLGLTEEAKKYQSEQREIPILQSSSYAGDIYYLYGNNVFPGYATYREWLKAESYGNLAARFRDVRGHFIYEFSPESPDSHMKLCGVEPAVVSVVSTDEEGSQYYVQRKGILHFS